MSAYKFSETRIVCDGCNLSSSVDYDFTGTAKQVRAGLKTKGWTFKNRQDFCNICNGINNTI